MVKGLYIYDADKKEFQRRSAGRPWALDDSEAISTLDANGAAHQFQPEDGMPPVDPTPIRRRRRRYIAVEENGDESSKTWRWVMWVLITRVIPPRTGRRPRVTDEPPAKT